MHKVNEIHLKMNTNRNQKFLHTFQVKRQHWNPNCYHNGSCI